MSLDVSHTTEVRLSTKARDLRLSVQALLERLLNDDCSVNMSAASHERPELPVWHLGVCGSLRRRDLYS